MVDFPNFAALIRRGERSNMRARRNGQEGAL
ncbi:hypothetical protein V473_01995 [Sphingobium cupriresistens LL01]|uniref:Uncharacterized protein n=1 Tax=Sphingobium cupriresistens LL01 TaxID=1420583 RepID=A0A0J7Y5L1_9SPHN|nr:hypothetical protein V473_01995 [Sphingobium cupriresistens LL01]